MLGDPGTSPVCPHTFQTPWHIWVFERLELKMPRRESDSKWKNHQEVTDAFMEAARDVRPHTGCVAVGAAKETQLQPFLTVWGPGYLGER